MRELRKNPDTGRAGLKWDEDEDIKLLEQLKEGVIITEMAKNLQRTEGSIKTRIILNAVKKIDDDGEDPKTVSTEFNITLLEIKDYREKKIQRDEKINNYNNRSNNNLNNNFNKSNIQNPTIKDLYSLVYDMSIQINDLKNRR